MEYLNEIQRFWLIIALYYLGSREAFNRRQVAAQSFGLNSDKNYGRIFYVELDSRNGLAL